MANSWWATARGPNPCLDSQMREEAVAKVAEQRDLNRKDDAGSKEHLHPRRIKAETVSAASSSDAFMQTYMSTEAERARQEILSKD